MTREALRRRAAQLLQAGRVEEAIAAHRELLDAHPELADSWYNLGYLQRVARRFEEAAAAYSKAIEAGVSAPEEVHLNRAAILADHLDRHDEAKAELGAALALNPGFVPALLNLGMLHEDLGERGDAAAAYARALEIAPGNGRALARLAGLDVFAGRSADVVPRLQAALAKSDVRADDAAEIGFALGTALDALGRYDEAFYVFAAANAASRASAPPEVTRYDPAEQEQLIDRIIAAFPEPAARKAAGEMPPVFICGMFRSGSTLAEQILGAHSRVTAGGEFEFLPALVQQKLQPYPEAVADPARIEAVRREYLAGLRALFPNADVLTDKRPDNFLHIGLIKAMFPGAKIVHTRRDPRDTILSAYFLHFEHSVAWGLDLDDAAHWYRQYWRLMAHWRALYPDDIFDLDYEAVVSDPEPAIRALADFLGLEWEATMLSFHAGKTTVRTASVWQVRQPLHRRSAGRWRNYEKYLGSAISAFE